MGVPFRGVTKSGRVWRKVPESDARSVIIHVYHTTVVIVIVEVARSINVMRTKRSAVKNARN